MTSYCPFASSLCSGQPLHSALLAFVETNWAFGVESFMTSYGSCYYVPDFLRFLQCIFQINCCFRHNLFMLGTLAVRKQIALTALIALTWRQFTGHWRGVRTMLHSLLQVMCLLRQCIVQMQYYVKYQSYFEMDSKKQQTFQEAYPLNVSCQHQSILNHSQSYFAKWSEEI